MFFQEPDKEAMAKLQLKHRRRPADCFNRMEAKV